MNNLSKQIRGVVRDSLSHISTQPAKIAEDEICRQLNILVESYIKDLKELQNFQDVHVGLWATDKEPIEKEIFFQITKQGSSKERDQDTVVPSNTDG